jgi:polyisoprenoid-binding protein YceI
MNKKVLYGIGVLAILCVAAFVALGFVGKTEEKNPLVVENNPPVSETGAWTTVKDGVYAVSVSESRVGWEGKKTLIKDYVDTGTLAIKEGSIRVSEGDVTAEIVFDMTSIKTHSTGSGKGESGLERHLKSDDFFSVEAFPTSVFLVERVVPLDNEAHSYTATGKLTIKGITNEISVPVLLYESDGAVRVDGTVLIDRTKWDIRFGSDKFFDNLANNVIDDFFSVSFSLLARQ